MRRLHSWVVCAALLAGCGRIDFDPRVVSGSDSGGGADACAFGPWSAPSLIAELSTSMNDWGGQISPDGLTLNYSIERTVYVTQRPGRGMAFGTPIPLTDLGTGIDAGNPSATGDALELFFDSNRGLDYDIYSADRTDAAAIFGDVTRIAALDPGGVDATAPYITPDGLSLYYQVGLPDGTLTVTTRATRTDMFTQGSPVGVTGTMNGTPALSADQLTIYFEVGDDVSRSALDIYEARRPAIGEPFATPTIVSVSVAGSGDFDASITADGLELFFASDRPGGPGGSDLYHATRSCL